MIYFLILDSKIVKRNVRWCFKCSSTSRRYHPSEIFKVLVRNLKMSQILQELKARKTLLLHLSNSKSLRAQRVKMCNLRKFLSPSPAQPRRSSLANLARWSLAKHFRKQLRLSEKTRCKTYLVCLTNLKQGLNKLKKVLKVTMLSKTRSYWKSSWNIYCYTGMRFVHVYLTS